MIIHAWVVNVKTDSVEQELKVKAVLLILTVTQILHADETHDLLLKQLAKFQPKLMNTVTRIMIVKWTLLVIGYLQQKNCKEENDAKKFTTLMMEQSSDTMEETT